MPHNSSHHLVPLVNLVLVLLIGTQGCGQGAGVREASPERSCELHLGLLRRAICEYREKHGDLPRMTVGPNGDTHSWRVLVGLAHVDMTHYTREYHFDSPWHDAENVETLYACAISPFLSCPTEKQGLEVTHATYLLLVRPHMRDADANQDVAHGLPADAVLIVESIHSGIGFGEPRDLDWDDLWEDDSPFGPGKLHSLHPGVVKAMRVDGKIIDISKRLDKDEVRRLLSGTTGQKRQKR